MRTGRRATHWSLLRLDDHAVNVFTDGSCLPWPRRGGYAFLFVTVDEDGREVVEEFSGPGVPGANNQEMELTACVEALKRLNSGRSAVDLARFRKVVIHTDSMFVCENFDTAKFQWSGNRWMRKEGPPVLHAHLWKALVAETKRIGMPVFVEWVPGKSSPHTNRVDKLAKESGRERSAALQAGAPFGASTRRSRWSREASESKARRSRSRSSPRSINGSSAAGATSTRSCRRTWVLCRCHESIISLAEARICWIAESKPC